MPGNVTSSAPTLDTGSNTTPWFDTSGRMRVAADVSVVSEGTGTTLGDAADATVGSTAANILAADTTRRAAIIRAAPTNTANIRLGVLATVGAARGLLVQPGETVTIETTDAIAGYAATNQTVSILLLKD